MAVDQRAPLRLGLSHDGCIDVGRLALLAARGSSMLASVATMACPLHSRRASGCDARRNDHVPWERSAIVRLLPFKGGDARCLRPRTPSQAPCTTAPPPPEGRSSGGAGP